MPIAYSYGKIGQVSGDDLLIISDKSNGYRTNSVTVDELGQYIKAFTPDPSGAITDTVSIISGNATRTKVVTIPDGATSVDYTFGNDGFTAINLPDGLITIGAQAFRSNLLTSVTIPSTVTTIADLAFYNNSLLTTVNIPSGVTSIGNSAFYFTNLTFTDLVIPNSCSVGALAFVGVEVTGTLTINNNAVLGRESFEGGTFNNIVIGDNVSGDNPNTYPIDGPFQNATINGNVTIGDNINFNNMNWFDGATGTATAVSFGPNFSNSDTAFSRAPFTSYTFTGNPVNTIPDGVTLGTSMFEQSKITSVAIEDNVTIGVEAFQRCRDIASLTLGNNVTMVQIGLFNAYQFSQIAENVPGGIPVTIPGTTTLAIGSFQYANISSLTIQSGLTEIPDRCFQALNTPGSITSLSIPSTVLTFGDFCFNFQELPGLTTLTLGSAGNPVTVGRNAFLEAIDLTTVNIPTGSTYIAGSFPLGATINFY
jgi:hypothetical protein